MMRRVPRASGDKPENENDSVDTYNVFPAPAGINRRLKDNVKEELSVPRASGDKPGD